MSCIVHKFGGTSVGDAAAIKRSAQILIETNRPCVAVVSACAGVTDVLVLLVQTAKNNQFVTADRLMNELAERHACIAHDLLDVKLPSFQHELGRAFSELRQCLLQWKGEPWEEAFILGFGEYLSTKLLANFLQEIGENGCWLDARQFVLGTGSYLELNPDESGSRAKISVLNEKMASNKTVITQGFVASHQDGKPAVLGRGGSDFSAGFLAALLNAETLYIWTDTPGVLSADPRQVPKAQSLENINYEEAKILAQLGAKVLHPRSVEHPQKTKIPVWVKSSFSPDLPGTLINQRDDNETKILSITSKPDVVAVQATWFDHHHVNPFEGCRYESSLMSLNHEGFSAVVPRDKWLGFLEFANHNQLELEVEEDLALLSVVGHRLHERHVTIAETLQFLSTQNIPSKIAFISPKGTHFCVLLPKAKLNEALKTLHEDFFTEAYMVYVES